jgi:hypothetical protein
VENEITGWEQFASDLTKSFGQEFVDDFARTLTNEVRAEQEVVHSHAEGRQRRIAEATARLDQCYFDGLGELHMRVDADVFFNWVMREGRGIWNDPDFIKAFKRDNKDVIVKSRSRKTMVTRP